jgi:hypothetical protein
MRIDETYIETFISLVRAHSIFHGYNPAYHPTEQARRQLLWRCYYESPEEGRQATVRRERRLSPEPKPLWQEQYDLKKD